MRRPVQLPTVAKFTETLRIAQTRGIETRSAERWVRRLLKEREVSTGRRMLVQCGAKHGTRVNVDEVRLACPELFAKRDELGAALEGATIVGARRLKAIEDATDEMRADVGVISQHMREVIATQRLLREVLQVTRRNERLLKSMSSRRAARGGSR